MVIMSLYARVVVLVGCWLGLAYPDLTISYRAAVGGRRKGGGERKKLYTSTFTFQARGLRIMLNICAF